MIFGALQGEGGSLEILCLTTAMEQVLVFGKYKQTVQNREQSEAVIKNPDLDNDFGRVSR